MIQPLGNNAVELEEDEMADKPKRRKVQAMTLHREIMREAALCSRMKPKWKIVDGKPVTLRPPKNAVTPKSFQGTPRQ